jgi:hypothetical protein
MNFCGQQQADRGCDREGQKQSAPQPRPESFRCSIHRLRITNFPVKMSPGARPPGELMDGWPAVAFAPVENVA